MAAPAEEPAVEEIRDAGYRLRLPAPREMGAARCRVSAARHNTGTAISTVTRFVTPDEKPAKIVQPRQPRSIHRGGRAAGRLIESRIDAGRRRSHRRRPQLREDAGDDSRSRSRHAHAGAQERRRYDHPTRHYQEQPDNAAVGSDFFWLARDILPDSDRPLSSMAIR